jgi:hypothetical protein
VSLQDTLGQMARRLALLEETSVRRAALEVPRSRPPAVIVYHSASQSIANNTSTPVVFNTETDDPEAWHSTVTNPSRVTVTMAGLYLVIGYVPWEPNATGYRQASLAVNGGVVLSPMMPALGGGFGTNQQVTALFGIAAGDYIEMYAAQGAGIALNITTSPYLMLVRLGSYL